MVDAIVDGAVDVVECSARAGRGGRLVAGVQQRSEKPCSQFGVEDRNPDALGGELVAVAYTTTATNVAGDLEIVVGDPWRTRFTIRYTHRHPQWDRLRQHGDPNPTSQVIAYINNTPKAREMPPVPDL